MAQRPSQTLSSGATLATLPPELVSLVLALGSRWGEAKGELLRYMLVCRAFKGPAVSLLYRHIALVSDKQAYSFLRSVKNSPTPSRLTSSVRDLRLNSTELDGPPGASRNLVYPALHLLDNLRSLQVTADDGLRMLYTVLAKGGGGVTQLRSFSVQGGFVRWDIVVGILSQATNLQTLHLQDLFVLQPANASSDSRNGDDVGSVEYPTLRLDGDCDNPSPHIDFVTDETGKNVVTTANVPALCLPPPPEPMPFPSLPLRSLTLHQIAGPSLRDDAFVSIINATRHTLDELRLQAIDSLSRPGLIAALRLLPNLRTLAITLCRFSFGIHDENHRLVQTPPARSETGNPFSTSFAAAYPPDSPLVDGAFALATKFELLEEGSKVREAVTYPVSTEEAVYPLDFLVKRCAFLQVLEVASDHLMSSNGVVEVMTRLPLQMIVLDARVPWIAVEAVEKGLAAADGRIETVTLGRSRMDVTLQATAAAAEGAVTSFNPNDKYIGLALAISSSAAIGTSFIITKKGLISAADSHDGFSSESYSYLKNGLWWAGMLTIANFAAYTFAPPALVTPLGALSVLVGAILAAIFLGERLGKIGISGCSLCLVGSIIVVLHAPEDKDIATVDEILEYALQPGFMFYAFFVTCFSLYMIYKVAPKHGNKNPLVYLSICSLVGSISVMAVKGLGIALKLTFAGNNQLWRAGTWIFAITALDLFPTNVVNPLYFSLFSSATLVASIILFHGLNTSGASQTVSLICGFYTISLGVYLLNLARGETEARGLRHSLGDQRHSLLEQSNRLSLASDCEGNERGPDARNSTNLYRAGGATVGGVAPIFDYDETANKGRDEHMRMERFALRNDDSEDEENEATGRYQRV
ncbi:magnesium transporter NIPA-domain-containing protein [Rhodotorula toruloides]